jgi:hypothetical protein
MPKVVSPETKKKISESLKLFNELKKSPSPEEQRADMYRTAFREATGLDVTIRNYGKIESKEPSASIPKKLQNNAQEETV